MQIFKYLILINPVSFAQQPLVAHSYWKEELQGHKHVITGMIQEEGDSSLDYGDSSRNGGKCLSFF